MTEELEQIAWQVTKDIIEDRDIDHLSIVEMMEDREELSDMDRDAVAERVHQMLTRVTITITLPEATDE